MTKSIKSSLLAIAMLSTSQVYADASNTVRQALKNSMPSVKIDSIKDSEINGVQEVIMQSGIYYISNDGKYLLQGHLIDLVAKKDLTEAKLSEVRVNALKNLGTDNMIVFKSKMEKYKVSIFTDIDCGYCRKLHSEIDQYLAQGITIQYLFFPRAGKGSESYDKAIAVWCAKDRQQALTNAKLGNIPNSPKCDNPVDKHMALGEQFEVRGTPMIVTAKGNVLPGYMPAKQLASTLANE